MGFSVTAAHAVFFVALVGAAGVYSSVYWGNESYLEEARRAEAERFVNAAQTDLAITVTPSYNNGAKTYTFTLKNTGSVGLDVNELEYLVDGVITYSMANGYPKLNGVSGSSSLFLPGDTLEVRLTNVQSNPARLKVTAENGVSVYHP